MPIASRKKVITLPDPELRFWVERLAQFDRCSLADVVRRAVEHYIEWRTTRAGKIISIKEAVRRDARKERASA